MASWSFPFLHLLIQGISTHFRYRLPTPHVTQSSNPLKVNLRFYYRLPSSLSKTSNGGFICPITTRRRHLREMWNRQEKTTLRSCSRNVWSEQKLLTWKFTTGANKEPR